MTAKQQRNGIYFALTACATWGLFPLFFRLLGDVDPVRILAHRALWAGVISVGMLFVFLRPAWRRWRDGRTPAKRRSDLRTLALAAVLLASNWLTYIHAVTSGQVLEASLGYFICPLVSVVLGMVFLQERLSRPQAIAVGLAAVGVLQLAVRAPSVPWLALYLAVSFSFYGLVRKKLPMEPLLASCLEAFYMAPLALIFLGATHAEAPAVSAATMSLLVASGAVTAIPLMLYATAARRMPYSSLALLQYITPTLQFALAVWAFGEPMTAAHGVAFGLIWVAVGVSSVPALIRRSVPVTA